ncbi:MAG: TerC family protein, partial [Actinobacteria bacterium]
MPRRLPTLTLSVGLAVVLFATLRPARGQDPAAKGTTDNPGFPRVNVELVSGQSLVGTLRLAGVGLKTDTDTRTIDLKHVRRVTFQKEPGGHASDTVQLNDKSVVRGRVLQD